MAEAKLEPMRGDPGDAIAWWRNLTIYEKGKVEKWLSDNPPPPGWYQSQVCYAHCEMSRWELI